MARDTLARSRIYKIEARIRALLSRITGSASEEDLQAVELRVSSMENSYVKVTNFEIINTAVGSIAIPTGGEILFNEFNGEIDAVVSEVDGSNTPTWQNAKNASGDILTVTSLNAAGDYTLSGTPTGDIAIVYVYRVQRKDLDYTQSIGFETLDLTGVEVKSLYEGNLDTNAFTDAEKTKLGTLYSLDGEVKVTQASDLANIDSNKIYRIDGKIDMGTQQIEVPPGGFFFSGSSYFVSCLFSTADNYTMFVNKSGGPAGPVRGIETTVWVDGINSQVFDLDNQGNNNAVELLSCNIGDFSTQTTSVGTLSNYRQFRTDDFAFIRVADGLEFDGTWAGGFAATGTILLAIPASTTVYKAGPTLDFQGSSTTNLNAISTDNSVIVFDFAEANFSRDEGFAMDGARFNLSATNPVPNMPEDSTKRYFRDCSGVKNTFPGGRWEVTAQALTTLSGGLPSKAAGTTTYDDLVHFSQTVDNAFVYDSTIEKDFVITGQLVVDGGANDEIEVILRKWDDSAGAYVDIRSFVRNISNIIGGLDIAYFDPYAPVTLDQNDRVEVWLQNNTDDTDATLLTGSFLAINVRQ